MIATHSIKVNGKWHMAGEEISPANPQPVEKITENSDKQYTKTDINRMSTADLQKLAAEVGIDTTEKSGGELKKLLIEHYGL